MSTPTDPKILVNKYIGQITQSVFLLSDHKLYGQFLIIFYASIDAMGLLDASPDVKKTTNNTFKNWVNKFFLPNGSFAFNAEDMWGARCSVLHTYTTSPDHSKQGKAKELQYIISPISNSHPIVPVLRSIDNGQHVEASISAMQIAFLGAVADFGEQLIKNCHSDQRYLDRLRKTLNHQCISI